jgi:hypothetical protein
MNPNRHPTPEEIAECAYFLYLNSGRPEGRDLDNWLAAERQLTAAAEPKKPVKPPKGAGGARQAETRVLMLHS